VFITRRRNVRPYSMDAASQRAAFNVNTQLITGQHCARSAKCRYLSYSEADFEVLHRLGEISHRAKFHLHRCNDKGIGPPKLEVLLRFDQNVEYKRAAGAYPLCDFHMICRVCTSFQNALKLRWFCSRGYGVMAVLS